MVKSNLTTKLYASAWVQAPRAQEPIASVLPDAGTVPPSPTLRGFGVGDGLGAGPTGEEVSPQAAARSPTTTARLCFVSDTVRPVSDLTYMIDILLYSYTEQAVLLMPPIEKASTKKGRLNPAAQRVLLALVKAECASPGEPLPMRKIAKRTLAGDAKLAARVLAELDLEGLVRTDVMGWHFGWLTAKAYEAVRKPETAV